MPGYNRRVDSLRESPTRRIDAIHERLARAGEDVIRLSTGQPGIPPPVEVRRWLAGLLEEESMGLYSYTPTPGIRPLREAISLDLRELGGVEVEPDSILVTAGGQEAMFVSLASILEEGDEVVLADPTYFGYWPMIEYFGARPRPVEAGIEEGFQPDPERVLEAVRRGRTKAIVMVTPDNPTGRVLGGGTVRALAEIAEDYGVWLVYDEAYKTLVYEGEHPWPYKHAPENTISINTFSKDPGMPGWRLGYVYGPRWIIDKMRLLSEEAIYCPPSPSQHLALRYLQDRGLRRRHIEFVRRELFERREAMAGAVEKYIPGARYHKPEGSMFLMMDLGAYLKEARETSEELAERLMEEWRVAVVPGSFFGKTTTSYIRLSFATETPERIREGVRRIGEALQG